MNIFGGYTSWKSTGRAVSAAAVAGFLLMQAAVAPAQDATAARTIVTATTKASEDAVTIPRDSITLYENRKLQPLTGWTPLRGERGGLQLVVLLDDASQGNVSLQWNELRKFLVALPATTQVAIGYMRNGTPNLVQNFTGDHEAAAQALRIPVGSAGINGSPYFCLSELVKRWPVSDANPRREVIMVTDGVDRYSGGRFDPENPYVQAAMTDAQRAGVIVYSIYFKGAGRFDQNRGVTDGGQNYLTQLSSATGGQVYLEGFGNPVSFAPFLSDIQVKLQNQYELAFVSSAKPGLQNIRVKTSQPNTKLSWPARVATGAAAGPH